MKVILGICGFAVSSIMAEYSFGVLHNIELFTLGVGCCFLSLKLIQEGIDIRNTWNVVS